MCPGGRRCPGRPGRGRSGSGSGSGCRCWRWRGRGWRRLATWRASASSRDRPDPGGTRLAGRAVVEHKHRLAIDREADVDRVLESVQPIRRCGALDAIPHEDAGSAASDHAIGRQIEMDADHVEAGQALWRLCTEPKGTPLGDENVVLPAELV